MTCSFRFSPISSKHRWTFGKVKKTTRINLKEVISSEDIFIFKEHQSDRSRQAFCNECLIVSTNRHRDSGERSPPKVNRNRGPPNSSCLGPRITSARARRQSRRRFSAASSRPSRTATRRTRTTSATGPASPLRRSSCRWGRREPLSSRNP